MKFFVLLIYSILSTLLVVLFYKDYDKFNRDFNIKEITNIEFPTYGELYRTIKRHYRTGDYNVTIRYYVINKEELKRILKELDNNLNDPNSKWLKEFNRYIFEQEKDDNEYFKIIIEENSDKYFEVEYGRQKYPPFKYFKHKSRDFYLGFIFYKSINYSLLKITVMRNAKDMTEKEIRERLDFLTMKRLKTQEEIKEMKILCDEYYKNSPTITINFQVEW